MGVEFGKSSHSFLVYLETRTRNFTSLWKASSRMNNGQSGIATSCKTGYASPYAAWIWRGMQQVPGAFDQRGPLCCLCRESRSVPTFVSLTSMSLPQLPLVLRSSASLTAFRSSLENAPLFHVKLCNAYTELNNPVVQRQRFLDQSKASVAGDEEAQASPRQRLTCFFFRVTSTERSILKLDRSESRRSRIYSSPIFSTRIVDLDPGATMQYAVPQRADTRVLCSSIPVF